MPSESVLLFNATADEMRIIEDILSRSEVDATPIAVSSVEDMEELIREKGARLVIIRIDGNLTRPDQFIRRLKRSLKGDFLLLVLVPGEKARNVRDYLHAGADDYWMLPLDASSFASRLYVMLEWGNAVRLEDREEPSRNNTFWRRIGRRLRRVFSFVSASSEPGPGSPRLLGGKWEMVRRLGFGSYGEVWLIRDREAVSLAVAKIPHSTKMNAKFLREASILKRLAGSPNAVHLKEIVRDEEKVVLIEEYAEGLTLQERMDQGMSGAAKERVFLALLDVVAFAHRSRIAHRDIKPENIVIGPSGGVKLLDFGTGKDLTRASISSTIIGSRPFMAPEQIMGKSRIASDVWALGVILYMLATECLPFYDDNEKQLMDLILETEPESPRSIAPDMPEELEGIILKCLRKDWARRCADASELKSELLRVFPTFGSGEVMR
jgi:hypothetical protein